MRQVGTDDGEFSRDVDLRVDSQVRIHAPVATVEGEMMVSAQRQVVPGIIACFHHLGGQSMSTERIEMWRGIATAAAEGACHRREDPGSEP